MSIIKSIEYCVSRSESESESGYVSSSGSRSVSSSVPSSVSNQQEFDQWFSNELSIVISDNMKSAKNAYKYNQKANIDVVFTAACDDGQKISLGSTGRNRGIDFLKESMQKVIEEKGLQFPGQQPSPSVTESDRKKWEKQGARPKTTGAQLS